jgi:hypothetical protein
MQRYIDAIRKNVCSICVDSTDEGECTLSTKELCAVEYYFPKILEVVHSIDSEDLEVYHEKLKDTICAECAASGDKDHCYLRDDANCSLDRYFSIIVETIKKVDAGLI